ncbi:acyl-CoA dehydrogenase family protein [Streptomyces spectabilis]|uniref:Acyl-CoA dehydrogenase n=1 Tax=Streptomyces spectabilis TaxID=68270 RepID=A0A5P2X2M6_STRST|nr:acyl-CoA dehydrogenase family protein [Streptomyces spectabilis]MBB5107928.1 alkylation response protein AidB-like acyl-CoA dehydrogenase [Streptomyces spectabilis]MCI3899742.1 acyl-CoA/acyl-ACP dehydrogenase [Streptomyces spectabilis]QEV57415.1 acyl-CoA dehydrogenase [Streptomyces spectabilis]GGV52096.1 oxidoreductase [Streptomyces spectabilis]
MRFLQRDHDTCEALLPGLADRLADVPFDQLESPKSPAVALFKEYGGTNLLVPGDYGGIGASALEAVRVIRALASLAPSLAVATAMHHFSVGMLFSLGPLYESGPSFRTSVLEAVAKNRSLIASGYAEGRSGHGILTPTVEARETPGGYLVSGSKKPCSLSRSMDLLTASVALRGHDGATEMGLLVLPADTPGISVHDFWSTFPLVAAESHEVRLTDVFAGAEHVLRAPASAGERLDALNEAGVIWFQMIVAATYTGVASALVDQVLRDKRGPVEERAGLCLLIESAASLVEGLARRIMDDDLGNDCAAASLFTRFTVQPIVTRAVAQAVEMLGGMAFITSPKIAYLASAAQAVVFHPPSRTSMSQAVVDYYTGKPLFFS